jgi:hypothetical protein
MTEDIREKLEELMAALESDVQLCTTRDQHIRAVQRLAAAKYILDKCCVQRV